MKTRKKIIKNTLIISTLVVLLSSCSNIKVREDLKNFTDNFSLDTCMEKYKAAEVEYTSEIIDNGEISASRDVFYSFDMNDSDNYTSLTIMSNSGLYITSSYPEYKYSRIERTLEGEYEYQEVSKSSPDGEESVTSHLSSDAFLLRLKTFYRRSTEQDGGNSGGMYYGDDIKSRFSYQNFMKIDTERNLLIYDIVDAKDSYGNVTSLYYEVNHDGMLLYWKQSGYMPPKENSPRSFTAEMTITYK